VPLAGSRATIDQVMAPTLAPPPRAVQPEQT